MTSRNEPCHCGSGLKYKKCHGKGVPKGGSPYEKCEPKPRVVSTAPTKTRRILPQMVEMAMYGMMQRMRQERRGN